MKIHTTNYKNTFIEVAEDCPADSGQIPLVKGEQRTIANIQYDLISRHPYKYTSDEILFHCFAEKNNIDESARAEARVAFFSKGQPCLRSSPLAKRYGFGIHSNGEKKVALFGKETKEYREFSENKNLYIVKAMRSKRS